MKLKALLTILLLSLGLAGCSNDTSPPTPEVTDIFYSGDSFNGNVYLFVTSPDTGRVWLDRNLGATQACTFAEDTACYGEMYQWGRSKDGHESRTSSTSLVQLTNIDSISDKFINLNSDWTLADSNGLNRITAWSDGGNNDVCPLGFRVPTEAEFKADTIDAITNPISSRATAYLSFLKLGVSNYRNAYGISGNQYGTAYYWSSSPSGSDSRAFYLGGANAHFEDSFRGLGTGIRCIQD